MFTVRFFTCKEKRKKGTESSMFYPFRSMNFSTAEEFFKCKSTWEQLAESSALFAGCLRCTHSLLHVLHALFLLCFACTLFTSCGFLPVLTFLRQLFVWPCALASLLHFFALCILPLSCKTAPWISASAAVTVKCIRAFCWRVVFV